MLINYYLRTMYNEEDDARLLLRCAGLMFVFTAIVVFLAWAVFEIGKAVAHV